MTQEEKELLLKDLSARLPYGVKVTTTNPAAEFGVMSGISIKGKISVETKDADIVFECTEVKPYLRPMSSMTKEEEKEFVDICTDIAKDRIHFVMDGSIDSNYMLEKFDWLNKNHFDYRGLIPKRLAIAVTEENNPYL